LTRLGIGFRFRFGWFFFGIAALWQAGVASQGPEKSNCTTTETEAVSAVLSDPWLSDLAME
jgi:hypothetical protein